MRSILALAWLTVALPALAQPNWGVLEDFEFGFLSPWTLFGDPEPLILVGAVELGSSVLVPNGDDRCPSGIHLDAAVAWGDRAGFAVNFATDVASDGRRTAPQELLFGVHEQVFTSGGCANEMPPRPLLQIRVDGSVDTAGISLEDADGVVASRDYPASADRSWHWLSIQQLGAELVAQYDGEELGRISFATRAQLSVFLGGRHPAVVHVFDDLRYLLPRSVRVDGSSFGRVKALYASGFPRASL